MRHPDKARLTALVAPWPSSTARDAAALPPARPASRSPSPSLPSRLLLAPAQAPSTPVPSPAARGKGHRRRSRRSPAALGRCRRRRACPTPMDGGAQYNALLALVWSLPVRSSAKGRGGKGQAISAPAERRCARSSASCCERPAALPVPCLDVCPPMSSQSRWQSAPAPWTAS
jgi:hypothetical protein